MGFWIPRLFLALATNAQLQSQSPNFNRPEEIPAIMYPHHLRNKSLPEITRRKIFGEEFKWVTKRTASVNPNYGGFRFSLCSAFAFLMGEQFELVGRNSSRLVSEALMLFADPIYGARYLNQLETKIAGLWPAQPDLLKRIQTYRAEIANGSDIKRHLLQQAPHFAIPEVFYLHALSPTQKVSQQGRGGGFIQNDHDESGRMMHYLFHLFLASVASELHQKYHRYKDVNQDFEAEIRTFEEKKEAADAERFPEWVLSHPESFLELFPKREDQERLRQAIRSYEFYRAQISNPKLGARYQASARAGRAQALKEMSSRTDIEVNRRGRALWKRLESRQIKIGWQLNQQIYQDLCDEDYALNQGLIRVKGPLNYSMDY